MSTGFKIKGLLTELRPHNNRLYILLGIMFFIEIIILGNELSE